MAAACPTGDVATHLLCVVSDPGLASRRPLCKHRRRHRHAKNTPRVGPFGLEKTILSLFNLLKRKGRRGCVL